LFPAGAQPGPPAQPPLASTRMQCGAQFSRVLRGRSEPLRQGRRIFGGHLGQVRRQVLQHLAALRRWQVRERLAYLRDVLLDLLRAIGDGLSRLAGHTATPRPSMRSSMVWAKLRQVLIERLSWSRPAAL